MNKETLLQKLRALKEEERHPLKGRDAEDRHLDADYALLEFINDDRVKLAFDDLTRWYA